MALPLIDRTIVPATVILLATSACGAHAVPPSDGAVVQRCKRRERELRLAGRHDVDSEDAHEGRHHRIDRRCGEWRQGTAALSIVLTVPTGC